MNLQSQNEGEDMKQICFPGLRPKAPTIRTERVARRVAERIIAEVNLDDFYWTKDELPDRIEDVTRELMRGGRPATVFCRLHRKQLPINCRGDRGSSPYGWDGIDEHCRAIADDIANEIVASEIAKYNNLYGTTTE